jgi:hypothetical protein
MKIGDLVRYKGTGELFVVTWSDGTYVKLGGFPDNQVFLIKASGLEKVNEDR